jgi:hypothetical protein
MRANAAAATRPRHRERNSSAATAYIARTEIVERTAGSHRRTLIGLVPRRKLARAVA